MLCCRGCPIWRCLNRLKWANAHLRWPLASWRSVLFTDESPFQLYRTDGRRSIWRRVGEWFADVNIVNRVPHGGVMVWAGISYGHRKQLHFINGNFNAQRYNDEILRSIVVPFLRRHHLKFQHDNARRHVASICTQFLEAEHFAVLPWPAYSYQTCHPLSMFGMLWIDMYDRVFQFPPISSIFTQPLMISGTTFHRPQ